MTNQQAKAREMQLFVHLIQLQSGPNPNTSGRKKKCNFYDYIKKTQRTPSLRRRFLNKSGLKIPR
jgi:hypothetical protein